MVEYYSRLLCALSPHPNSNLQYFLTLWLSVMPCIHQCMSPWRAWPVTGNIPLPDSDLAFSIQELLFYDRICKLELIYFFPFFLFFRLLHTRYSCSAFRKEINKTGRSGDIIDKVKKTRFQTEAMTFRQSLRHEIVTVTFRNFECRWYPAGLVYIGVAYKHCWCLH